MPNLSYNSARSTANSRRASSPSGGRNTGRGLLSWLPGTGANWGSRGGSGSSSSGSNSGWGPGSAVPARPPTRPMRGGQAAGSRGSGGRRAERGAPGQAEGNAVDIWSAPSAWPAGLQRPETVAGAGAGSAAQSPGEYVASLLSHIEGGPSGMSFADWVGYPVNFRTGGVRGSVEALFNDMMPFYNNDPWAVAQAIQQEFTQSGTPWTTSMRTTQEPPATQFTDANGQVVNPQRLSTGQYERTPLPVPGGSPPPIHGFSQDEIALLQQAGIDPTQLATAFYAPNMDFFF